MTIFFTKGRFLTLNRIRFPMICSHVTVYLQFIHQFAVIQLFCH